MNQFTPKAIGIEAIIEVKPCSELLKIPGIVKKRNT
jgi:hypothetical protein